jgi:Fe-Mn family superoxide dismutase
MFTPKQFNIPEITGISKQTLEGHLKLYEGYVKHTNLIADKLKEYSEALDQNIYVVGELNRRFSFEFNGMRNHEYYFEQLEGGAKKLSSDSLLARKIEEDFGSFDKWLLEFKTLALTRGIGWAVLWYDRETHKLINSWVDEQHLGHLNSCQFIFGIDMWEHAYILDHTPADKKVYIESFIHATNFEVCTERFAKNN